MDVTTLAKQGTV